MFQYHLLQSFIIFYLLGLNLHVLLSMFNIVHGKDGVKHYAMVHRSKFNALVHTFFMPLTMFGFYLSVPAVFGCDVYQATIMKTQVMIVYLGHYSTLNTRRTLMTIVWYSPSFLLSTLVYARLNRVLNIIVGVSISFCSLLIQEVFGHWVGGDPPSRMNAYDIFNAVLYAVYFSVSHVYIPKIIN